MKIKIACGIISCLYASAYASDKDESERKLYEAALEVKACRSFTKETLRPLNDGVCPGAQALYLTQMSSNPTQYTCEQLKLTDKQTREDYINRLTKVRNQCKKEWIKSNSARMKLVRCGGSQEKEETLNKELDT